MLSGFGNCPQTCQDSQLHGTPDVKGAERSVMATEYGFFFISSVDQVMATVIPLEPYAKAPFYTRLVSI